MCVVSVCVVRCVISELHSCGRQLLGGGGTSSSLLLVETCPFCADVDGSGRTSTHFYLLKQQRISVVD